METRPSWSGEQNSRCALATLAACFQTYTYGTNRSFQPCRTDKSHVSGLSPADTFKTRTGEVEKKVGSTWDLTEEGIGVLAEGSSHGGVQAGLAVTSRQLGPRVVTTLVVVVLDVEVDQLGEVDT